MKRVLVTGATGKIASLLIPRLAVHPGIAVRALVRNAERAEALTSIGVELAIGTLDNVETIRRATEGIDTVLLITAATSQAAEQADAVLAAAIEGGVRKIVRISILNASRGGPADVIRQHGYTDARIWSSGMVYTILRAPFFMQNLGFLAGESVTEEGKLYFGTADGRLGLIDLRDVVDCSYESIVSDIYLKKTFTLTGPESISFHDIANRLSDLLGHPVQYIPIRPEAVEESLRARGHTDWYAGVMRDLCRAYSGGWGDVLTGDVTHMTGRRPRSFDVFAREVLLPTLIPAKVRRTRAFSHREYSAAAG